MVSDLDPEMTSAESSVSKSETIDPPPFLRTWPQVYTAVLVYLGITVALLYLVTRAFNY